MKKSFFAFFLLTALAAILPVSVSAAAETYYYVNSDFKNASISEDSALGWTIRNDGTYSASNVTANSEGLTLNTVAQTSNWMLYMSDISDGPFSGTVTFETKIKTPAAYTGQNLFAISTNYQGTGVVPLIGSKSGSSYFFDYANGKRFALRANDWQIFKVVVNFDTDEIAYYNGGSQVINDPSDGTALPVTLNSTFTANKASYDTVKMYYGTTATTATQIEYIKIYKEIEVFDPPAPETAPVTYTYVSSGFDEGATDSEKLGVWTKRNGGNYLSANVTLSLDGLDGKVNLAANSSSDSSMIETTLPDGDYFYGTVNFEADVYINGVIAANQTNQAYNIFTISQGTGTGQLNLMQINYKALRGVGSGTGGTSPVTPAMAADTLYKVRIKVNFINGDVSYYVNGDPVSAVSGVLYDNLLTPVAAFSPNYGYNTVKMYASNGIAGTAVVSLDNIKIYREAAETAETLFYRNIIRPTEEIASLNDGKISAVTFVPNISEAESLDAAVIAALYKDNRLIKVSALPPQTVAPMTAAKYINTLTWALEPGTEEEGTGEAISPYKLKLFIWDSADGLKPVFEASPLLFEPTEETPE